MTNVFPSIKLRNSLAFGLALLLAACASITEGDRFVYARYVQDVGVRSAPNRVAFKAGDSIAIQTAGNGWDGKQVTLTVTREGTQIFKSAAVTIPQGKFHWWNTTAKTPGRYRATVAPSEGTAIYTEYSVVR